MRCHHCNAPLEGRYHLRAVLVDAPLEYHTRTVTCSVACSENVRLGPSAHWRLVTYPSVAA